MNVLKRSFAYIFRKIGKSIVLFLLLLLITTLVTIGFSMLDATQKSAANLRETVGASFSIQGKINELSFNENGTDYTANAALLTGQNIAAIMQDSRIKAYNAVQTSTVCADGLHTLSGRENCPISANTETDLNSYFCMGTLTLTEGNSITACHSMAAVISNAFAAENNLTVGSELVLSTAAEKRVCLKVIGLYESEPSMEFDDDTVFLTHDAYWELTGNAAQTYSGKVHFIVHDPLELDDVMEKVKQTEYAKWDNYIFLKSSENYEAISYQLSTMEQLAAILIVASVIISAILFFLILVMRIRNRVHEAGIMLAIGISKSSVIIQYITEVGILLLLSVIVSYFASIVITAVLTPYLQSLISGIIITIPPDRLALQYLSEIIITVAAVLTAAIPIIHLKPKDILSKMS